MLGWMMTFLEHLPEENVALQLSALSLTVAIWRLEIT